MTYSFVDLVDLDTIRTVIESFYKLTGIPPSLTDMEGNVLLGVGWQRICSQFHRRHPECRRRCKESDTQLASMLDSGKGYACYDCLNGLTDLAMPIVIEGKHVANLFTGQFFFQPPDRDYFRRQAREMGFDEDDYLAALDEVPVFDRDRVEQAVLFLADLAALIAQMGLKQKRLVELNEELEHKVVRRTERLRREVEDRRQAQQELAQTLSEFETVFANSSVGILHLKGGRRIHRVNRRFLELFGYDTESQVKGQSTRILHLSERRFEEFGNLYYNLLARTEVIRAEYQMRHASGSPIWCFLSGRAVNPPHMEQGAIWVIEDIGKRKELEALREDMERITRHDLKAPLTGIIAMARSLILGGNLSEQQLGDIKLIETAGVRLHTQINQSLELLRMEAGEYELKPEPVDLAQVTRRLFEELGAKARKLGVKLKASAGPRDLDAAGPILARGEEMLVHTLLANLLHNAVEASPRGGEVEVDLSRESGQCMISVHNRGVVPEQIRDAFFGKYISMGKPGGTGLGTYSARLMTEVQGGTIAMTSSEAEGTLVTVRLPKARTAPKSEPSTQAAD